ncbi:MAG: hypothetical protein Q9214_001021 [Letrouitia sp. 1 TL-2023]
MRFSLSSTLSSELPSKLKTKIKSKVKSIANKLHIHNHKRRASRLERPSCDIFKHVNDDESFPLRQISHHKANVNNDESFPFHQISHHKANVNIDESFPFRQISHHKAIINANELFPFHQISHHKNVNIDESFPFHQISHHKNVNIDESFPFRQISHHKAIINANEAFPFRQISHHKATVNTDESFDSFPFREISIHKTIRKDGELIDYDERNFANERKSSSDDTAADTASDAVSETGTIIYKPSSPNSAKPWYYEIIALRNSPPHLEKHYGRHLYQTEPDFVKKELRCANTFASLRSDSSSLDYAAWNLYKDSGNITLEQLAFADLDADSLDRDTQPPTPQIKLAAWLLWEEAAEITLDRLITSLRNPIAHLFEDRTFAHGFDHLEAQSSGWRMAADLLAKDCKIYTLAHLLNALKDCVPRCILNNSDSHQQILDGDHCPYIDCRSRILSNTYRKAAMAEENSVLLRSYAAIRKSSSSETAAAKCSHRRWFLDARGSQITIEQLCHAQARSWQSQWARSKYDDRPATPEDYYGEVFRTIPRGAHVDVSNFDIAAAAATNNNAASDASVDRPLPATASSRDRGLHFEEVPPLLIGKPPTELRHPSPQRSTKSFLEFWDNQVF